MADLERGRPWIDHHHIDGSGVRTPRRWGGPNLIQLNERVRADFCVAVPSVLRANMR
jgi:hypothetical protein